MFGGEPEQRAERVVGTIHRKAAPRREVQPLGADGTKTRIGISQQAEENIGFVLMRQRTALVGLALHPGADGLHGDLFKLKLAAIDKDLADGCVGMARFCRKAQPDDLSRLKPYTARTLHMKEEGVDRAFEPEQRELLRIERAILDLGAGGEGAAAFHHAEARRWCENRRLIGAMPCQRAIHFRFVIAGEKAALFREANRHEPVLEKAARIAGTRRCFRSRLAGRLPVARTTIKRVAAFRVARGGW